MESNHVINGGTKAGHLTSKNLEAVGATMTEKPKKKKVKPADDPEMAELIRTIYHSKLKLNMNDIPNELPLEEKAYKCWQARVDARRFARLLWKEHDISRYEYLEREFPERSYKDTVHYYNGDLTKVVCGANRTNKQVDEMTFDKQNRNRGEPHA